MLKIKEITDFLESIAPLSLQEPYDNSGLILGNYDSPAESALVTVDVTEEVVDEAINLGAGIIIAHHPVIFSGLKKITGKNYVERIVLKAILNNIAIYAAHTNFDNIAEGVSSMMCKKIGLLDCKVLDPGQGYLRKLVTFIPTAHAGKVGEAVFRAGAGHIGNYDSCGFNVMGKGSFRGGENTNPYVGEKGVFHVEEETRFETIFPEWIQEKVIRALIESHPYEEVAYDIYPLNNKFEITGMGMVGHLPEPIKEVHFLSKLKSLFGCNTLRHTTLKGSLVQKVAVCGGAGSFLINKAISSGADFYVTGDIKYHQFFDAEKRIVIADIGHYESEQFTKELFYELLTKKFPTFAVHLSEVNTNPVFYF